MPQALESLDYAMRYWGTRPNTALKILQWSPLLVDENQVPNKCQLSRSAPRGTSRPCQNLSGQFPPLYLPSPLLCPMSTTLGDPSCSVLSHPPGSPPKHLAAAVPCLDPLPEPQPRVSCLELSTHLWLSIWLRPSSRWLCCQGTPKITQKRCKALNFRTK